MAFFCEQTGIRITAPGVHKSVDPKNGHPAFIEENEAAAPEGGSDAKPEKGSKKGDKPEKEPPAAPEGGSDAKPEKGSK